MMKTSVKFDEKTKKKLDKLMKKVAKFEDDIRKGKKNNVDISEKIGSVDNINTEIRKLLVSDPTLYVDKFYKDEYDGRVSYFHIRGEEKGYEDANGKCDRFIITEVITKDIMCDWCDGEKVISFKLVPVDYLNINDTGTREISAKKFKKVFNKINRELKYAVTTDYEDTL